jgi:hypothetical protein
MVFLGKESHGRKEGKMARGDLLNDRIVKNSFVFVLSLLLTSISFRGNCSRYF